uniref:Calcium-activated potassium channel subunit alpha-1-like n=1 Tax=Sinocyclocheilus anshuiensis TaxID=1608454 RepID=A0A671RK68_9TELE
MDPKHKELLEQCQQKLSESVTDVDRVLELLAQSGCLSPAERAELDANCSGSAEKVLLLLKTLLEKKDRDHFQEFCWALEKTQPVLLGALLPVKNHHSSGSTCSVLSAMPSDSESSSSLSSVGESASSPPPAHLDKHVMSEKLETVIFQLRQVTRERDDLRKRLALSSPGTTFDDCRPSVKPGHDYERLKLQCMKAMSDLQSLQNQHTKTLKRCEEAARDADYYHTLHGRVFGEQTQLRDEMEAMKQNYSQLLQQHSQLQQTCDELRRIHDSDQREVADMRLQQQQVPMPHNGSSDLLNKLYDMALNKLEGMKKEYDALRKRYNEKASSHNADLSRLEQMEEENRRLQKQQRDSVMHFQQQYSGSVRRFESLQQELNKASAQNEELQRETDRLQMENTRYKTLQLKAVKDGEKLKEERDSVLNEYRLIMSERDQVIKEVDKLHTGLEAAEAKLKNTSSERRVTSEEIEALRQKQDSATLDMERVSKELEVLRKQCEAVSEELQESVQEAEVAKCRRDWAFQERDKIVAERESIRTLCDNLRRERDRAVSDLADALRNLDDLRKQKNDAVRELKELKECMEEQLEKEACFRQLMAHNSHDSAIDTDSLEWETEMVEFERSTDDMDLSALGFDIAEGVSDPYLPGDYGIFVSKVDKGSIAEGRLRVNDWLLKINDVDLANKDRKKQVIKAVFSGGGVINMVVRRRKSLGGRMVTSVHLTLAGHKDCGVGLESGVFVSSVSPGSPAARDGSVCPGDRVLNINGISLDNKSVSECESLLRSCRDSVSLSLLKFFPQSLSGQSIAESQRDCERNSSADHLRPCRKQPTHKDMYSPTRDVESERGQRGTLYRSEPYHEICCPHPTSKRALTFHPVSPGDCITMEMSQERRCIPQKQSGGTWPKMVAVAMTTAESIPPLSIFKTPKKRKSIFDADMFKRPETPSKLDYLSLSQMPKHSLQSSWIEALKQYIYKCNDVKNMCLDTAPRTLSPYPAVTAVMRNPVYTAWSHCIKTTNSPSVPAHTYTQVRYTPEYVSGVERQQFPLRALSLSQYREQRIKIPSTPRYARSAHGSDRGSLSHSDCSSPSLVTPPLSPLDSASFTSSQSQGSISAQTRLSVSPVPIDRRRDRPYIEEPRCVTIPKGAEPLGISIVGGENGGIFVSKVTGGSIAQQHRLEFGDQLLEFNGINLRNATEQQARLIIGQQCDTITILAQYNPHMHQLGNHSRSRYTHTVHSSLSSHSTPDTHSNIDTLSEQDEGTMTPASKQATPTASPHRKQAEPRLVVLRKTQVDLGLKICGGNLTGVFVEALEEDSPARGAEGLQPGDLILECNSVSLKKKTAEEVYLEMLKPSENVTLRVQHRPEHFRRVKEAPADGFYIRALFDHVGDLEQELSFKKDDILYVDDTMPGGNLGYWLAWQLDENAQKLVRGHVPSKCMIDQDSQRQYSVTDGKDDSSSGKTLSAAARRSFFRRKLKHKRSSSKEGRDAPAADAVSTDSMPFMDDCLSPAYQRVQKVESTNRRPVLILGPLVEPIKDMLLREAPGKYCRCLPEGMKATQQAIERGVKDCLFIDYKRRSGHFDVTTVASIKEITEKDCHCLLDIAPHAIERLHVINIYPIVIFIRYRNAKQIKEQKDPVYLRDKVSQKHSKEQFESAQRIEQDYSKYLTGVVQAGSLSNICTQIMAIVDQEQNKVLWIPDGSM